MTIETVLKNLLHSVNAPYSEYRNTYNKLHAPHAARVNMKEDSQEATIIENALIVAALEHRLPAIIALDLLQNATTIETRGNGWLHIAHKDEPPYTIKLNTLRI